MEIMQIKENTICEQRNSKQRAKARRLIRGTLAAASVVVMGVGVTTMAGRASAAASNYRQNATATAGETVIVDNTNSITSNSSPAGTLGTNNSVGASNGGSVTLTGSTVTVTLEDDYYKGLLNTDPEYNVNGFFPKGSLYNPNSDSVKYAGIGASGTGTISGSGLAVNITTAINGAVSALNGGQVTLSNSSITGNLADTDALYYYWGLTPSSGVGLQTILSQGSGSKVTLDSDTITTNGADYNYHSAGITAQLEGTVVLGGNTTVNSHGNDTYGISAEGWTTGGTITTDPNNPLTLNVTTDGDNSPGIFAGNAPVGTVTFLSSVNLDGTDRDTSSITTTGANSDGVKIDNGSSVTLHNITVNPEGVGSDAVHFVGDGNGIFTGDTVTLNGDIVSEDDGTNTVNLQNNSILNGNITNVNTLYIDSSSIWNNTGDSTVNNFTNGNYVFTPPTNPADSSQYHTLTANNFTANPGSTITMNVFADGSNSTSDQVVVNNSYTGSQTQIIPVVNHGSGNLPNGGIVLVQGSGSSFVNGDFVSAPVNSGFYTYTGDYSNTSGNSQFLLSSQLNSAVVGASVLPALGTRTILSTLPSVQDRMHAPRLSVTGTGQGDAQKGIWARLFGGSNKFRSDDSADNGFDTTLWAVQAGYDLMAKKDANGGRSYAGLYLAYGNSSGNAQLNGHDVGSLDLDATSVGAYWTKYTPSDAYLSVTGQYSQLNGIQASGGGESVSPSGSGYALSLEGGKTLNREKSFMIEPQAQLIYSHTNIDDSTLPVGPSRQTATPIDLSNLNAVTGRLGVLFQKNPDSGENFLPWARVNLWHTFSGSSTMSSPGLNNVETSMNGTSAELTAGFNLLGNKDSKWAIDASAGYLFNLSGAKSTGWLGNLGARYNF